MSAPNSGLEALGTPEVMVAGLVVNHGKAALAKEGTEGAAHGVVAGLGVGVIAATFGAPVTASIVVATLIGAAVGYTEKEK